MLKAIKVLTMISVQYARGFPQPSRGRAAHSAEKYQGLTGTVPKVEAGVATRKLRPAPDPTVSLRVTGS